MPVSAENQLSWLPARAIVTTTILRYSPRQRARTPSHELPVRTLRGSASATTPSSRTLRCANSAKSDAKPAFPVAGLSSPAIA